MPRNPTNWDEYQYGTSHSDRGSVGSAGGRSLRFSEQEDVSPRTSGAQLDAPGNGTRPIQRRRSSIALRLNGLAQVGGVNSIENFARSWTRAAGFPEVAPQHQSFVYADNEAADGHDETIDYRRQDPEHSRLPRHSLIGAHLEASGAPENAIDDESIAPENEAHPSQPLLHKESAGVLGSDRPSNQGSVRGSQSIFGMGPNLAGSYGTSYGTMQSVLDEPSMNRAAELWRQQEAAATQLSEGEREPLVLKAVEQDGKKVLVIAGRSTLPQTIFNSTNVLIGVGLLSLPMGIKYAGWLCGMGFLFLSAVVTAYTAGILAKCMDVDASLITFADLAFVSYGHRARIATSVLFMLELLAACVALIVLFADTLNLLVPAIVVLIIFIDGFIKPNAPGSLREPAETHLFPQNWLTLPISFGLLMSPWGGHSVFPNIYRDMRHPYKFKRAVRVTFSFTYLLDCLTAVAGYLMFGDGVMDEITSNLIGTPGYPHALSVLLTIFIAIIPLTKLPLNARPIYSTIEVLTGLNRRPTSEPLAWSVKALKIALRIFVIVVFVVISILFPHFDSIMAFMGSALCFAICIILPLLFYVKIFGKEISTSERMLDYFLIGVCSVMAAVGTVWAFLPKSLIGTE
ncbi:uncharacterized protein BP5553_07092 [Venustampulla echinocandica]|uniref:Amino acid transporter transmembrane domain-containing protein n=1 Tax=Venustampulla echinocandica TaxID=2656787 RepID=A0A370TIH6_9HELO|nr:uncharacterized protein BP5553_07092 [Venustampulla echinocandica]RDL35161.1 hypothetical protein BP5553_07092 [Venustampulla echinocandica]